MEAEKIDIPEELKILDPESQKQPIVVGKEGYMIYPLTEGQAEHVSKIISDVITDITTMDLVCPNCDFVYKNQLGKQETCNRCNSGAGKRKKGHKHALVSLQKPPVEALVCEDRLPKLIEEILGIPSDEVKSNLTVNQFKHIAGILYVQNFKEEGGGLPDDSRKNFKALLDWTGLGAPEPVTPLPPPPQQQKDQTKKTDTADSEKSTKPSPTSTDLQESMSEEDGKIDQEEEQEDS